MRDRRILALAAWLALVTAAVVAAGHLLGLAERPGGSTSPDRAIITWVVAHRTGPLTTIARGFSLVGSQVVLLGLVAVVLLALGARRRWGSAAALAGAWAGAIVVYSVAKPFVSRPRPPTDLWLTAAAGPSFPSGHATQSAATYAALALLAALMARRGRVAGRLVAVILAAGVGWSRVYLGVHWPTDVGVGWLAGTAWIAVAAQLTSGTGRPSSR